MTDNAAFARAFEIQAAACVAFGSPFSGALLNLAKADIEAGGQLVALLEPWAGASTRALFTEAVPIRWLGCVHDLALTGNAPGLTHAYPSPDRPGDAEGAWAAARAAMAEEPERFAAFMSHEPQTNEVRRSACLLPGFLTLAAETGLPLRLFEVGASAGLNQLWDRFRFDYGPAGAWGDPASPVLIDAEWRGAPGPIARAGTVTVVSRSACDRKPVDIRDVLARRRLKAYVWADQFDRLSRLEAALALALGADVRVDADDAVAWTSARAAPAPGAATVLFHSIFWQYMPPESQTALTAAIAAHGAAATADAPFAWLRMEPPPTNLAAVELRLTLWPGGQDRLLGHAHPHGAWVEWAAAEA
jgi:hypothetical protein